MTQPPTPADVTLCPSCHAPASGKYCSSCGAALGGAQCATCSADLTPGARFCHRCGASTGVAAGQAVPSNHGGWGPALPWAVAAIALVALVALVAGQRFGRTHGSTSDAPFATSGMPAAGGLGRASAVDISNMTPVERATRLYGRVLAYFGDGKVDSARMFAPMAVAAYQMLDSLTLGERFELGRVAAVAGDIGMVQAQSDTILNRHHNHLLGLMLGANAAFLSGDSARAQGYLQRLHSAAPSERAKKLPEYQQYAAEIDAALAEASKEGVKW